jgi:hypothetical protein
MPVKKQMNNFYTIIERVADKKPNTHVIQKLDELRRIARQVRGSHTPSLHPTLTAKLIRALEQ